MNDIQEQYIPYTTSAMSANASSGQPSDIAYDQSAEIAEHITSKACYNYSDPWQLPQNLSVILKSSPISILILTGILSVVLVLLGQSRHLATPPLLVQ